LEFQLTVGVFGVHSFIKLFVVPVMKSRKWSRICEVGSCQGEGTNLLKAVPRLHTTSIDPCLDANLQQKFAGDPSVDMRRGLSLDVLPKLTQQFDCILIDGDHNWYTVYNELKVIAEKNLLRKGGIIFLHDVERPWGRRDLYYQLDTIPPEYRQQALERWGNADNKSELISEDASAAPSMRARFEGGARNGVLTAIEDFTAENKKDYRFFRVSAGHGLGIIQYRGSSRDTLSFFSLVCKGLVCNAVASVAQAGKRKATAAAFSPERAA
jgi:hypothetical protein